MSRYFWLLLLNTPVIALATIGIITQFKLKKISARRFRWQMSFWLIIAVVLIAAFPIYNYFTGQDLATANDLSWFDIVEITAIVFLFYIVNHQRQKISKVEQKIGHLHRELSIKLSEK